MIALELANDRITSAIQKDCLDNGLLINVTHGNIIRLFPALTITKEEMNKSLVLLKTSIAKLAKTTLNEGVCRKK